MLIDHYKVKKQFNQIKKIVNILLSFDYPQIPHPTFLWPNFYHKLKFYSSVGPILFIVSLDDFPEGILLKAWLCVEIITFSSGVINISG